jgi:hypothetical protein
MIAAAADAYFGYFQDVWTKVSDAIPAAIRTTYLAASREAVTSIVADYRASASIDVEHDEADRRAGNRLGMPVTALRQDLGAEFGAMFTRSWRAWAPDLEFATLSCGHFMAEEAPAEVAAELRRLMRR